MRPSRVRSQAHETYRGSVAAGTLRLWSAATQTLFLILVGFHVKIMGEEVRG